MEKDFYLSPEGRDELMKELEKLMEERQRIKERIKEAKEYGDLSENAEYIEAKNKQSFVEGRIDEIEMMLKKAKIIDKSRGKKEVSLGSRVKVRFNGQTVEYLLTGSSEANPASGKISNESPLGKVLLGKKKGDKLIIRTPKGSKKGSIVAIN